jgi:uncharacterized protein
VSGKDYRVFSTESGGRYLYDANTNTVHPLPVLIEENLIREIYETVCVSDLSRLSPDSQTEQFLNYVILWRKNTDAFFSKPAEEKQRLKSVKDAWERQKITGLPCDLVLIVTEQCNMRCAYCVYDENLYQSRRNHKDSYMSQETARKAIDSYFDFNKSEMLKPYGRRALNIVFYGGEALLNWPVIQKSIVYINEIYDHFAELHIGISTNLTLLKSEWLPFLRDNEVFLNVSLDGPAEEHDRYRRFASGKPTQAVTEQNLKAIRAFDAEYYDKYVKALVTFNGNTDFAKVIEYYNEPTAPKVQMVSPVKDWDDCGFHKKYPYDGERFMNSLRYVKDLYLQECMAGRRFVRGDFLYAFAHEGNSHFFNAGHMLRYGKGWHTGSCLPGRKLAIAPDGNIHICERVSMKRPVGHIDTGPDETKILDYFNEFLDAAGDCPRCWARNRCRICPADADNNTGFHFGDRCEKLKDEIQRTFCDLYSLLEKKPDLFENEFPFY